MSRMDRRDPTPLDYAPPKPRIWIVVPWWAWLTLAAAALLFWSVLM
jgi:hypothetical protein